MSLRTARRNARLSMNYGLARPIDERSQLRVPEGVVFVAQRPNALAEQRLQEMLLRGERLREEAERNAGAPSDGDEAESDDRIVVGDEHPKPVNPFAI
jgi:hypothetical protein